MEKLTERLREIYGGRKWVVAVQAAAGAGGWVDRLAGWGSKSLVVASTEGTGDLPDTEIVYTRSGGESAIGSIREFFDSVVHPTTETQTAVDNFDLERAARVLAEPYATAKSMLDRPTFGVRKPEWSAWEDKMRVDQLWQDIGIPHAPYEICAPSAPYAAERLTTALGTVWVADNSQGWHGGGEYVRWVPDRETAAEAATWFADRADRVRVMPFLDGLPCSIHGWVTASGVAVFLPVEIITLRGQPGDQLIYAGVSTVWTASPRVVDEMRAIALKVGKELGRRDRYRGPFGIDGVLASDGFRPTELNPRMSVGAGVQIGRVDIPLGLLMRAEAESLIDVDHEWLEEEALAQREPHIHFGKLVGVEVRDTFLIGRSETGRLVEVESAEDSFGEITAGPSSTGSFITGKFETEKIEQGQPVGPLIALILNLANDRWDLGLPELTAAPSPSDESPG